MPRLIVATKLPCCLHRCFWLDTVFCFWYGASSQNSITRSPHICPGTLWTSWYLCHQVGYLFFWRFVFISLVRSSLFRCLWHCHCKCCFQPRLLEAKKWCAHCSRYNLCPYELSDTHEFFCFDQDCQYNVSAFLCNTSCCIGKCTAGRFDCSEISRLNLVDIFVSVSEFLN